MKQRENKYHENKKWITTKMQGWYGDYPSEMASLWWTEEDWNKWKADVEEYKANGLYGKLTPVFTLRTKRKDWERFSPKKQPEPIFSNFGIMVPTGDHVSVNHEQKTWAWGSNTK